jgi:hypothetical protein
VGQAAIDACNPRQVLVAAFGVNDVAKNDVADVFDIDSGAGDGFPHTRCGHLTGRGILQAAAVSANRRSNSAKNYNFFHIKLGRNVVLLLKNRFSLSAPAHRPAFFASSLPRVLTKQVAKNRLHQSCPTLTILCSAERCIHHDVPKGPRKQNNYQETMPVF